MHSGARPFAENKSLEATNPATNPGLVGSTPYPSTPNSRSQIARLVPKPEPISSNLVPPPKGADFANKPARFKDFFKSRKSDTLSASLKVRDWSGEKTGCRESAASFLTSSGTMTLIGPTISFRAAIWIADLDSQVVRLSSE